MLLVILVLGLLIVVSHPLASVMPDLTIKGALVTFQPPAIRLILIPLFLVPLGLACNVLFSKPTLWSRVLPILLFMIPFQLEILGRQLQTPVLLAPLIVACSILLAWLVFTIVLRTTCMRRCLGTG